MIASAGLISGRPVDRPADGARRCSRLLRRRKRRNGSGVADRAWRFPAPAHSATPTKPFMSAAPRPNSRSSRITGVNGSVDQSWPSTGTTSVWPESTRPPFCLRSDGGEQIGLCARPGHRYSASRAGFNQHALRGVDQWQIGVAADGVEGDQPFDHRHETRAARHISSPAPSGLPMMARNSRRVLESSRNAPSIMEVTMVTPVLCTPRVVMH